MSDWDVTNVVINAHGGNDQVKVTSEMVVDEDEYCCVVAHPLKLGYLHFVIVPKEKPHSDSEDATATTAGKLQETAFETIKLYSQQLKAKQFLSKKKGLLKNESNRWTGIDEIRSFSKTYSTAKLVPFSIGFLGFEPEINEMQLHVISKDFNYIKSRALWNLYTTSWGLISVSNFQEMITSGFGVALTDYSSLIERCKTSPYTCYVTGMEFESLSQVREQSLLAQLGTNITVKEKVSKSKLSEPDVVKKPKLEEPSPEPSVVKPPKPSSKVKACKESITSAFLKWSEYYFRLKKVNVQPGDEDLALAVQQMKDLSNHSALSQIDRAGMAYLQKQAREKVFGKIVEVDAAGKQKRKMEWDGTEFVVNAGETELQVDEERVPF